MASELRAQASHSQAHQRWLEHRRACQEMHASAELSERFAEHTESYANQEMDQVRKLRSVALSALDRGQLHLEQAKADINRIRTDVLATREEEMTVMHEHSLVTAEAYARGAPAE